MDEVILAFVIGLFVGGGIAFFYLWFGVHPVIKWAKENGCPYYEEETKEGREDEVEIFGE